MLTSLWFDFKYAWRLAVKSPRHFLLCCVVVALSIGLALWAYILVYTLALKPLTFPGSNRWLNVQVSKDATSRSVPEIDRYTYQQMQTRTSGIDYLGAYSTRSVVLSEDQASTSLRAAEISPSLLAAMDVRPFSGRLFDPSDSQRGATRTAIISYDTWSAYFANNPGVVGSFVRIDGTPVQIVGIMPSSFFAFDDYQIWFPLQPSFLPNPTETGTKLYAFIALKPGQRSDTVLKAIEPAVNEVNRRYPAVFSANRHVVLVPAHLMMTHGFLPIATMITLVAIAVLLLGSVNISLIFLAKLLERTRELALRTSLGSSRWRVLRLCLLESVFVVVVGLLLGIGLTAVGVHWTHGISDFLTLVLANGRDGSPLTIRPADLAVATLVATFLWLLSTLIPAWKVVNQEVSSVLNGSGKGATTSASGKSVAVLVGVQVIVSCLVLVICVNLLVAVHEEAGKPTGVHTSGILISTYPTLFDARHADSSARRLYWDDLAAAISERVPRAEVAYATAAPTRPESTAVALRGQERTTNEAVLKLPVAAVSGNYFSMLGIHLLSGRLFEDTDTTSSLPVAVVDETTAQRYWPNESALGKQIEVDPSDHGPWLTIVGVVSHVGHEPYSPERGLVYRPLLQANPREFLLLAKVPDPMAPSVRAAIRAAAFSLDQELPVRNLQLLDLYLRALNLFYSALVPVFAVIAAITVALAASGLFGLISRSVARRTHEVGIRLALGSTPNGVVMLFMRQGWSYLAAGAVGGGVGLLMASLISRSIPNILTHALVITTAVFLLMALVISAASYLPIRRAVALDPAGALHYE